MIAPERTKIINNDLYNVVTMEEYYDSPQAYTDEDTAIMIDSMVLPIRKDTRKPGIVIGDLASKITPPPEELAEEYSTKNMVDPSNPKSFGDAIRLIDETRDVEREVLLNVDNVTIPRTSDKDSPLMSGLKEAITAKHCDMNSYSHRFGGNYNNDKRLMEDTDISIKKAIVYGNAMDMKITVTIEDAGDDVPNPIGHKIVKVLTGGSDNGSK